MKKILLALGLFGSLVQATNPIISYVQLSTGATQNGGPNTKTATVTQNLNVPYVGGGIQCLHSINGVVTGTNADCVTGSISSGSNTIVASPQFQIPFYSSSGSTNTLTGASGFNWYGSSVSVPSLVATAGGVIAGEYRIATDPLLGAIENINGGMGITSGQDIYISPPVGNSLVIDRGSKLAFIPTNAGSRTSIQSSTATISALLFTLPASSGTAGQILSTDGNGLMYWTTASGGGGGGGNGTIVASPQFQVPYYSVAGTTTTVSGASGVTINAAGNTLSAAGLIGSNLTATGATFLTGNVTANPNVAITNTQTQGLFVDPEALSLYGSTQTEAACLGFHVIGEGSILPGWEECRYNTSLVTGFKSVTGSNLPLMSMDTVGTYPQGSTVTISVPLVAKQTMNVVSTATVSALIVNGTGTLNISPFVTSSETITGQLTLNGPFVISSSSAGQASFTEGIDSSISGQASGVDLLWASASSHTFVFNPNNTSTYTVVGSSTVPTSGHVAVWSNQGSLVDGGIPSVSGSSLTVDAVLTINGNSASTTTLNVLQGNIAFPYGNSIVVSPANSWPSGTHKLVNVFFNSVDDEADYYTPGSVRSTPVMSMRSATGRTGFKQTNPAYDVDVNGTMGVSGVSQLASTNVSGQSTFSSSMTVANNTVGLLSTVIPPYYYSTIENPLLYISNQSAIGLTVGSQSEAIFAEYLDTGTFTNALNDGVGIHGRARQFSGSNGQMIGGLFDTQSQGQNGPPSIAGQFVPGWISDAAGGTNEIIEGIVINPNIKTITGNTPLSTGTVYGIHVPDYTNGKGAAGQNWMLYADNPYPSLMNGSLGLSQSNPVANFEVDAATASAYAMVVGTTAWKNFNLALSTSAYVFSVSSSGVTAIKSLNVTGQTTHASSVTVNASAVGIASGTFTMADSPDTEINSTGTFNLNSTANPQTFINAASPEFDEANLSGARWKTAITGTNTQAMTTYSKFTNTGSNVNALADGGAGYFWARDTAYTNNGNIRALNARSTAQGTAAQYEALNVESDWVDPGGNRGTTSTIVAAEIYQGIVQSDGLTPFTTGFQTINLEIDSGLGGAIPSQAYSIYNLSPAQNYFKGNLYIGTVQTNAAESIAVDSNTAYGLLIGTKTVGGFTGFSPSQYIFSVSSAGVITSAGNHNFLSAINVTSTATVGAITTGNNFTVNAAQIASNENMYLNNAQGLYATTNGQTNNTSGINMQATAVGGTGFARGLIGSNLAWSNVVGSSWTINNNFGTDYAGMLFRTSGDIAFVGSNAQASNTSLSDGNLMNTSHMYITGPFGLTGIGMGGTVPSKSQFQVLASTTATYSMYVSTTNTGGFGVDISTTGHFNIFNSSSTQGPTLSNATARNSKCSDAACSINATASPAGFVFAKPYTTEPACAVTERNGSITNAMNYVVTASSITVIQTSLNSIVDIHCFGGD